MPGRRIDFDALELHAPGRTVRLTLMEVDLLRYLIRNRERIVSRKELLEQVWHVREDTDTRAIDNFIVRLRRYIEDDPAVAQASGDRARRRLPLPAQSRLACL